MDEQLVKRNKGAGHRSNRESVKFLVLSSALVSSLSACGGGGGAGGNPDAIIIPADAGVLSGVAVTTGADPLVAELQDISATIDDTGQLTVTIDGYDFVASSGFENGIAVEDGATTGLLAEITLLRGQNIIVFDGVYNPGTGTTAVYYGLAGPALQGDLTTSGSASWSGIGFANLVTGSGTEDLGVGTVGVTANFGGGNVTAIMTDLVGTIDEIRIVDMAISGGSFSDGEVTFFNDGSEISPIGPVSSSTSSGVFAGDLTDGVPDEVGGLFVTSGDTGTVIGGFLAD